MSSVMVATVIMAGLGLLFATILAVAWRFLRVPEDPRIEAVEQMLPASNCGACGQPGCRAFAEKLVEGRAEPGQCTVSSPQMVEAIAELLGVDPGGRDRRIARLHCAGGRGQARDLARYQGVRTCAAAAAVGAGGKSCSWGCLGLGDCERACTFDAIEMNGDGLPVVEPKACTACGACVDACPRHLFELLPEDLHLVVQCSAPLSGEQATGVCRVACDACGRCAMDAAPGLVTMVRDLPVVDPHKRHLASRDATLRCPTGAIQWVEGRQFEEPPGSPPLPGAHPSRRDHVDAG